MFLRSCPPAWMCQATVEIYCMDCFSVTLTSACHVISSFIIASSTSSIGRQMTPSTKRCVTSVWSCKNSHSFKLQGLAAKFCWSPKITSSFFFCTGCRSSFTFVLLVSYFCIDESGEQSGRTGQAWTPTVGRQPLLPGTRVLRGSYTL